MKIIGETCLFVVVVVLQQVGLALASLSTKLFHCIFPIPKSVTTERMKEKRSPTYR